MKNNYRLNRQVLSYGVGSYKIYAKTDFVGNNKKTTRLLIMLLASVSFLLLASFLVASRFDRLDTNRLYASAHYNVHYNAQYQNNTSSVAVVCQQSDKRNYEGFFSVSNNVFNLPPMSRKSYGSARLPLFYIVSFLNNTHTINILQCSLAYKGDYYNALSSVTFISGCKNSITDSCYFKIFYTNRSYVTIRVLFSVKVTTQVELEFGAELETGLEHNSPTSPTSPTSQVHFFDTWFYIYIKNSELTLAKHTYNLYLYMGGEVLFTSCKLKAKFSIFDGDNSDTLKISEISFFGAHSVQSNSSNDEYRLNNYIGIRKYECFLKFNLSARRSLKVFDVPNGNICVDRRVGVVLTLVDAYMTSAGNFTHKGAPITVYFQIIITNCAPATKSVDFVLDLESNKLFCKASNLAGEFGLYKFVSVKNLVSSPSFYILGLGKIANSTSAVPNGYLSIFNVGSVNQFSNFFSVEWARTTAYTRGLYIRLVEGADFSLLLGGGASGANGWAGSGASGGINGGASGGFSSRATQQETTPTTLTIYIIFQTNRCFFYETSLTATISITLINPPTCCDKLGGCDYECYDYYYGQCEKECENCTCNKNSNCDYGCEDNCDNKKECNCSNDCDNGCKDCYEDTECDKCECDGTCNNYNCDCSDTCDKDCDNKGGGNDNNGNNGGNGGNDNNGNQNNGNGNGNSGNPQPPITNPNNPNNTNNPSNTNPNNPNSPSLNDNQHAIRVLMTLVIGSLAFALVYTNRQMFFAKYYQNKALKQQGLTPKKKTKTKNNNNKNAE